ncbi:MAG TPA: ATPase domain-containing protein, partial [Duganella sp.]|uniref:ATPase domain-containing protein n=1 Tax=Duganella sp. TaxID=1904440 RepID=UPI002ED483A3
MEAQNSVTNLFLGTGVPGLDAVLGGGLTRDRLYLIEGEPGTGKTTLALQFL